MIVKILLIGCGNIGYRHLEGLLNTDLSLNITVIEISQLTIKEQIKKIKQKKFKNKKIIFSNNFSIRRLKFDFVICATTAYKRFDLIKKLVNRYSFSKILIEKLAFQNVNDFEDALQLFKKNEIQCWVNCPRREFKLSKKIKRQNKNINRLSINASGDKWNMASNAVHIFDLFYFLVNTPVNFTQKKINLKKIPSKHHNFFELTGKLKIYNKKYSISMSDQRKNRGFTIKVKTPKIKYYIDENKKFVKISTNNKIFFEKITIPLQSQLTKNLIKRIVYNKKISLPTLSEAYLSHKLVYFLFKNFLNKKKSQLHNFLIT